MLESIRSKITTNIGIPNYSSSKDKNSLSKQDRDDRKIVERVIGRLVSYWNLEKPRHLGREYVAFNLQTIRLCDIFQVIFNFKIGNSLHPQAIIPFRGKIFKLIFTNLLNLDYFHKEKEIKYFFRKNRKLNECSLD